MTMTHRDKYERFARLHDDMFVLPTIWDPLSAIVARSASFDAVATSSASVAFGMGRSTDAAIPLDELLPIFRRINDQSGLPLSVDFESGYPDASGDITESIRAVIQTGAIAVNIEDNPGNHRLPLTTTEDQKRRIEAAQQAAASEGVKLFVNARTDVWGLIPALPPESAVAETIARANAYADAGANGIYVMARELTDGQISEITAATNLPLTLRAPRQSGSFSHWRTLGVRRVSLGTHPIRETVSALSALLSKIRSDERMDVTPDVPGRAIETVLHAFR